MMKQNLIQLAIIVVLMLIGGGLNFLFMFNQGYRLPDPVKIDYKCQMRDGLIEGEGMSLNNTIARLKDSAVCLMRVTPETK